MADITVLGAGRVGSAIALDLAEHHSIQVADQSLTALEKLKAQNQAIHIMEADISDQEQLNQTIEQAALVICAMPGFMGYTTLQAIIQAGKNVVDISFAPENVLTLNELALSNNVTAIVDCGVAPGLDNLLLGYWDAKMYVTHFECLVGGLPKRKTWPFFYKAPFSPIDVLEEYTRPARMVESGIQVTKPALSEVEHIEFDPIGTLEAFNTDGLRSLLHTMKHIPNMREKTLRYPGHIRYIKALKAAGFFGEEPIDLDGHSINPKNFTAKVLFDNWFLKPGEKEFTVMRIIITGKLHGITKQVEYNLYDEYNKQTGISSMARTTGYTATAAAQLLLDGTFTSKGIIAPEKLGQNKTHTKRIISYLDERGIHLQKKER